MNISSTALDQFSDYCFVVNDSGLLHYANKTYLNDTACSVSELAGKPFSSLLHADCSAAFEANLKTCRADHQPKQFESKFPINGDSRDVRLHLSPAGDADGIITYLIVARDITDEKKRETELLRYYFVAQNTVNPLQITDLSGKMIFVNPAFERASGYTSEELIGNDPSIFSSRKHPKSFWDGMWRAISSGEVWAGEVENRKKNGEPFFTQLLISPIIDSEQKVVGYFGIHRDLTDKRNLEKQLIHTQKMESIGTLAAGVAHEVGNPLASISALVQIIQRQTGDEFIKEKLELVKKQITRISKIIRDLVDFSRPSNFELRLTDINESVRESVEIVRVGKKAKDITFNLQLDETLTPLRLVSDQMQQVFLNILINAVDAVHEKRNETKSSEGFTITARTFFKDNHFVIEFEDNGTGVKDHNIGKIFEPFFTTKIEGKGTGLGLWVSYGIIKSFQGDIRVESKYGKYTRFIITLPINPNF